MATSGASVGPAQGLVGLEDRLLRLVLIINCKFNIIEFIIHIDDETKKPAC